MAYGDNVLGASHKWTFNNVLTDDIGGLTLTNSGGALVATPITRDSTHSYQTNGRDDLATVATTTTSGSLGFSRYAFHGFFRVSQIQGPPCMVYKQGGNTAGISIFIWAGNNIMVQIKDINGNNNIQIYSDIALTNNRTYHFFVRYSGSGFSNEIEFYLDRKKQTRNNGTVLPGATAMTAHTGAHNFGENGATSDEVNVGDETVLVKAPVNGLWSQWWIWIDAAAEAITEDQILNNLFAPGAIPSQTISSDTPVNMQAALDAFASTVRGDETLCFLIEDVSGGGDLTPTLDNITFNDRASIHFFWEGTGTLTLVNQNGSNASNEKVASENGTVQVVEAVPVLITVRDINTGLSIEGARVFLREETAGPVLVNDVTDVNGQVSINYDFVSDQIVTGRVRKGTSSPFYKTSPIVDTISQNGLSVSVLLISDE